MFTKVYCQVQKLCPLKNRSDLLLSDVHEDHSPSEKPPAKSSWAGRGSKVLLDQPLLWALRMLTWA